MAARKKSYEALVKPFMAPGGEIKIGPVAGPLDMIDLGSPVKKKQSPVGAGAVSSFKIALNKKIERERKEQKAKGLSPEWVQ